MAAPKNGAFGDWVAGDLEIAAPWARHDSVLFLDAERYESKAMASHRTPKAFGASSDALLTS